MTAKDGMDAKTHINKRAVLGDMQESKTSQYSMD